MTEPKALGRVDWMPHKKVWRVIWYKGAADIPAGDYPTRKEAEDALRELVARGNPTPVSPELGKSIAEELDVRFIGVQEGFQEIPATMLFVDKQTGSTFAATSLEGARTRLAEVRKSFEKPVAPELGKSIAEELDVRFIGVQEGFQEIPAMMLFVNKQTGSTFAATSLEGARTRLAEVRKSFEKPVAPEVTKLTGDIWNRMTPVEREQLGIKAKLDAARRGTLWIELFPEEKRALIREYKTQVTPEVAIPKAEAGNPGFTAKEAKSIGEKLGIDFKRYDVEQFRQGLNVELEHCNVTGCDPILTGKIAQAHLNELPDYYTRLAKMERLPEKQLTNKGVLNSSDKAGLGKDVEGLLPMSPEEGPPLPRKFALKWPWKK